MELDLTNLLMRSGLVGLRVTGVCLFAPFFGGVAVPSRVKAALTVALTLLLVPQLPTAVGSLNASGWARLALSEAVIGLVLGLTVQIVFEAAQFAGSVLGVQMGFSLVNVMDPQTQVDTPVLAIFHQLVVLLIFLQLNVHHWILRGLARSFQYLPGGSFAITWPATNELLHAVGGIFLTGVQIAAPVLAATLLADVALGFLGKASPQMPVLLVGLSVKSILGLIVIGVGLAGLPRFFEHQFLRAVEAGGQILALAH